MCDFIRNLITSNTFLTVISGTLVFVLGQLFNEYFLKPIQIYKKIRSEIAYSLVYYANLYMNPIKYEEDKNDEWKNGSIEIRKLAAEINAMGELRPYGNKFIPTKEVLNEISSCLIGISNGFFNNPSDTIIGHNEERRNKICKMLNINC